MRILRIRFRFPTLVSISDCFRSSEFSVQDLERMIEINVRNFDFI